MIKEEIKQEIYKLAREGMSSRKICKQLGWKATRKSTVSYILAKHDAEDDQSEEELDIDALCESDDWALANIAKRLRTAQRTNTQLRRIHRHTVDAKESWDFIMKGVEGAVSKINAQPDIVFHTATLNYSKPSQKATLEVLLSDFQIGKVYKGYNTDIALSRLKEYGNRIIEELTSAGVGDEGFDYERVVLSIMGDLVEDHMKHGISSAASTDSSLAEQMAYCIQYLWQYIVKPLASTGLPIDIIGIVGNHGSSQHKGMDNYMPGRFSYDYPIYIALKSLCEESGYSNVSFTLPEGAFGFMDIYGNTIIYEHGYGNGCTEKSMSDQLKKRAQQCRKYAEYFRCGDMHHVINYDCGRMVLNGAFFGDDREATEYSGNVGFAAAPAQVMMTHIPRGDDYQGSSVAKFVHYQFKE